MSRSTEVSAACALTLTAAITRPVPSRSGAATERMPRASCSSVSAQPRARTSRSAASRSARSGCQRGDEAGPASAGRAPASSSAAGSAASSTLPSEVGERREPGADLHRQADDLGDGHPRDVDDVRAVELGHRARLVGAGDQRLHVRAGDVPEALRPHVGDAEVEHPRGERVLPAFDADVAELGEREQDPAGGRAGQARGRGDLGEGQRAVARRGTPRSPRARGPAPR